MFFKGKHEAARMELRFINKTGNRHFDKPSYIYIHRIFGILLGYQGFIWEYGDLTSNILRYDLMIFNDI